MEPYRQPTTETTGDNSLKIFVQAIGNLDTDLYVAAQKIARDGTQIQWYNVTQVIEASAMHG
ncbi:hypothetical protein FOQG_12866 [Fusarium oxysporum f. sp. raphani 54005]|uniref:Uncharacterized protein n=1 Tax=Fusarium oxysporum f. sp. raphani 54005 TaxID=1089458 RepID=X0BV08_FUSOX|nr:hypothetical protein FOQG_12866 [Fusarium oxysporum f. sp. raphani 54005]